MVKEETKVCYRCRKDISLLDKQVNIFTKDLNEVIAEENFHFNCWIEEFKSAMQKNVKQIQNKVKKKAMSVMGILGNTLKSLGLDNQNYEEKEETFFNEEAK